MLALALIPRQCSPVFLSPNSATFDIQIKEQSQAIKQIMLVLYIYVMFDSLN